MVRFLVLVAFVLTSLGVQADAFARQARTVKVKMNATNPKNGKAWDVMRGLPDPYVVVNGHSYESNRCKNTYVCIFEITETDETLTIEVLDADVMVDDSAGTTTCKDGQTCKTRGATVTVSR